MLFAAGRAAGLGVNMNYYVSAWPQVLRRRRQPKNPLTPEMTKVDSVLKMTDTYMQLKLRPELIDASSTRHPQARDREEQA